MSEDRGPTFGTVASPRALPSNFPTMEPGELLRHEIAARGISQAELAARTGLSAKHVNQVIKGVVPLSNETALLVERATGVDADILSGLEARREARESRHEARQRLTSLEAWFKGFPVGVLARRGVLDPTQHLTTQIEHLLGFFGVADDNAFERLYSESLVSFRRAQHFDVDAKATAVWLRIAEREAERVHTRRPLPAFARKAFIALLDELPTLTKKPITQALQALQTRCRDAGVHVVLLRELDGTRACAATRWVADRPVVILSGRGKKQDGLWFNFFHEAGHIVLHAKRRSAVQLDKAGDDIDGHESEANRFAVDYLLRHVDPSAIIQVKSRRDAKLLAEALDIDPGIVAGQAAHTHHAWAEFNRLRKSLDPTAPPFSQ